MDQQEINKGSEFKSKGFNAMKEGKVKEALQDRFQDVQERLGEMNFDWRSILGAAAVIGAVGFIAATRGLRRRRRTPLLGKVGKALVAERIVGGRFGGRHTPRKAIRRAVGRAAIRRAASHRSHRLQAEHRA